MRTTERLDRIGSWFRDRPRRTTGLFCALAALAVIAVWRGQSAPTPESPQLVRVSAQSVEEPTPEVILAAAPPPRLPPLAGAESVRESRFEVIAQDGSPVPSAAWTVLDGAGSAVASGTTDHAGTFTTSGPVSPHFTIVVRHQGFIPFESAYRQLVPTPSASEPVTIRLTPGGRISGRVTVGADKRPDFPCTVLAVPASNPIASARHGVDAVRRDPRSIIVPVRNGRFEITELEPSRTYELTAGGSGYVSHGDAARARAGDDSVQLTLEALYAVRVELQDEDGRTIGLGSPDVYAYPGIALDMNQEASATLSGLMRSHARAAQAEVGLPDDYLDEQADAYVVTHLFTSESESDRVGPLGATIRVPGYQPVQAEVWAYRMRQGSIRSNRVRLTSLTRLAPGSLRISVSKGIGADAADGDVGRAGQVGPFLRLDIVPSADSADGAIVKGRIWQPGSPPVEIKSLPPGEYTVHAQCSLAEYGVRVPAVTVRVRSGEDVAASVDMPPHGALELTVLLDGRQYAGPAGILVREVTTGAARGAVSEDAAYFTRAPYRLWGLRPGAYEITFLRPGSSEVGDSGQPSFSATVVAGSLSRVQLPVRGN